MGIEAINGPVRSEPLNRNFSYLDSEKIGKKDLPFVNVKDFGAVGDNVTDDTSAIQAAIDSITTTGALQFEPGKHYRITSTLNIDVSKVRIIEGNNAYIRVDGNFDGVIWHGNKDQKGTGPDTSQPTKLKDKEFSSIIRDLQFYSLKDESGAYQGTGLVVHNIHSPIIQNCHFFNLDYGIEVRGTTSRNILINNIHCWDNRTAGIHFSENGEVHQCVISNSFISYSKYSVLVGNGHKLYNLLLSNCDLEAQANQNNGFESFIHFVGAVNDEIQFDNVIFQDHKIGTKELVHIENFQRLIFNRCYFSNTLGKAIYLLNGHTVEIDGIFERCADAIEFVNVQDIKASGVFKNLTGGCIRGRGSTDRFNIQGINAFDVEFIARINTTASLLGCNFSNNVGRPRRVPAIEIKSENNIWSLNVCNNVLYWNSDEDYNSNGYAISVISGNKMFATNVSNNTINLRSNHSINGINGLEVEARWGEEGVIIKNNIVDQLKASKGKTAFRLPPASSTVITEHNLSIREL